jgi:hypothetical protein
MLSDALLEVILASLVPSVNGSKRSSVASSGGRCLLRKVDR